MPQLGGLVPAVLLGSVLPLALFTQYLAYRLYLFVPTICLSVLLLDCKVRPIIIHAPQCSSGPDSAGAP